MSKKIPGLENKAKSIEWIAKNHLLFSDIPFADEVEFCTICSDVDVEYYGDFPDGVVQERYIGNHVSLIYLYSKLACVSTRKKDDFWGKKLYWVSNEMFFQMREYIVFIQYSGPEQYKLVSDAVIDRVNIPFLDGVPYLGDYHTKKS